MTKNPFLILIMLVASVLVAPCMSASADIGHFETTPYEPLEFENSGRETIDAHYNVCEGIFSRPPFESEKHSSPITPFDHIDSLPAREEMAQLVPITCPPLSISSSSIIASATEGVPYSFQPTLMPTAPGWPPYTFTALNALPPGLLLNSSTGLISGTPTVAGNYNFGIEVTDSCVTGAQTTSKSFLLTVNCSTFNMTTSSLPVGMAGQSYSAQMSTSGGNGPVTFSIISGSLPQGLSLGSSTGLITGVPNTGGIYNFTVRATDSCALGSRSIQRAFSLRLSYPEVTLRVSPPLVSVAKSGTNVQSITYTFFTTSAVNLSISSSSSTLHAGGTTLAHVNTPVHMTVINGTGSTSESLSISDTIKRKAVSLGFSRITYQRTFTLGLDTVNVEATINLASEAVSEFRIKRIQLYFDNGQAVKTVGRSTRDLKAFADISFAGSGILQGYWEVDGRILTRLNRHLLYGKSVKLETPEVPVLPTFDAGPHRLKFIIISPQQDIDFPEIVYMVKESEAKRKASITLISPENGLTEIYHPLTFRWESGGTGMTYIVEFYNREEGEPIFSAYTKKTEYDTPEYVLKKIFSPGRAYLWRVKMFDEAQGVEGESKLWKFLFR